MAASPELVLDPTAAMPDATDLLAQLGDGDPRMAALCRYFAQRQATAEAAVEMPDEDAPEPRASGVDPAAHDALQAEHARLQRVLAAMRRDLRVLRDHNARVAAALGACEACWGRDAACPHCAGRGRPGAESPDDALYARLVAPAVRRLRHDAGLHDARPHFIHPDRAAGSAVAGSLD